MVTRRVDSPERLSMSPPPRTGDSLSAAVADYLKDIRATAADGEHPLAVFDVDGQPVFRNAALAARLTSEAQLSLSERTWSVAYSAACRIVPDAIASRQPIAVVIPVHRKSFVILGSLLRQPTGTVYGAAVYLAEVALSTDGQGRTNQAEDADTQFRNWVRRRDEARARMQRLSPREVEVVARVAAGLPNKSIARELEISVKTVEKHRANAVRKLGVQSTPEMVRLAVLAEADRSAGGAAHRPGHAPAVPGPHLALTSDAGRPHAAGHDSQIRQESLRHSGPVSVPGSGDSRIV